MKLFASCLVFSSSAEIALSASDLEKFKCKSSGSWQLPQSCGSSCTDSDKANVACQVSLSIDPSDENFLLFTSNGVPDHNACAAAPQSTVDPQNYSYKIPRQPVKRAGNPEDFGTTNMAEIGFAINGVPFYNPYDAACCDAGLYELHALDLCYAHPNGPGGRYHYHVWSPCIAECTGESELVGIALDGFPIYGPGINPETGKVWSQSDMDFCGGKEVDGKYAYYVTVDFPYVLQCYRGETSSTFKDGQAFRATGTCAPNNEGCSPGAGGGPGGSGGPPPEGRPNHHTHGRKRRNIHDQTESWFQELEYLTNLGYTSSYSKEILKQVEKSRTVRSVETLSSAIDEVISAGDGRFTKEIYLKHLSYQCNSCNGPRDLYTNCSAVRHDTCTGERSLFTLENEDNGEGGNTPEDGENTADGGNNGDVTGTGAGNAAAISTVSFSVLLSAIYFFMQ